MNSISFVFRLKINHYFRLVNHYRALWDLFSFAVLSGNAAWLCTFVARERGEEGEWDEWGR